MCCAAELAERDRRCKHSEPRSSPRMLCRADWSLETREAIAALPVAERTTVVLRYVADLTQADIARAMRVSPGTVAFSLHTARTKLARLLAEPTGSSKEELGHG